MNLLKDAEPAIAFVETVADPEECAPVVVSEPIGEVVEPAYNGIKCQVRVCQRSCCRRELGCR